MKGMFTQLNFVKLQKLTDVAHFPLVRNQIKFGKLYQKPNFNHNFSFFKPKETMNTKKIWTMAPSTKTLHKQKKTKETNK